MQIRKIITTVILALSCTAAFAQLYPERKFIRSGNKEFENGDYSGAELNYLRAREKNPLSYETIFNLSDAYYKQERYEDAAEMFEALGEIEQKTPAVRSQAYYNQGNSLFRQEKLEEALEAYKNAMRLDPDDQQAKFNYAYTKKLLEKNDDNQDQDQNDDQDQDNDQDQNNDQDQSQDNDQKQDQNDNDDKKNDDQNDPGQDRNDGGMSRDEAERMLDAMQNSEDNTRDKMDAEKAAAVAPSGKNW